IAHDFNNILTGILGNLSLARSNSEPGGRVYGILDAAEKAAARAKDLTHQLMTFSHGKSAKKHQVSVKELIRECTGFILSGSNCRCQTAIAGDLWPAEIDESQISQVINNLLINANQAMPEGGVIAVKAENVELGAEPSVPLDPGAYVRIIIEDDGPGIQPENMSRVFDPYFTTKKQGSGLGLATSYSIIKSHGGHIMVDSEVGRGTRFTFYLPGLPQAASIGHQDEGKLYHGKGRILVMDDEPMIQQITGDMLTHLGYEAHFAKDGDEAFDMYQTAAREGNPFDLVVFDLTVPGGLGGHESLKKIADAYPDVNGVVSSGYSSNPIMSDYRKFGFIGALAKPYSIQQLSWLLNDIMGKSKKSN
ncbi:MAG: hybrid sensor histidine kinase/response regulator, partial [Puniceicoccales bacterium]